VRIRTGDYSGAIRTLLKVRSFMETNQLVWHELGVAYHLIGDVSNAVYAYKKAISLNPEVVETRLNLGFLYLTLRQADLAKREFTSCVHLRDSDARAWLGLGYASLQLREASNAERAFVEAIRLRTNYARAWNGWAIVQIQRGKYAEAARGFERAYESDPKYAPALVNYGILALYYLENYPLALEKFNSYLQLNPNRPDTDHVRLIVQDLENRLKTVGKP